MPKNEPPGCLAVIFLGLASALAPKPQRPRLPQMNVNTRFISYSEGSFYRVLEQVVGPHGLILMQVSIGQLIYVPGNNQTNPGRMLWWNKLCRRSVDFLICDAKTLRPIVAIELDDSSHNHPKRQQRDAEVNAAFREAGLPLLRIKASRSYNPKELAERLAQHVRISSDYAGNHSSG